MFKNIYFIVVMAIAIFVNSSLIGSNYNLDDLDADQKPPIASTVLKKTTINDSDISSLDKPLRILVLEGGAVRAIIQKIILLWLKLNTGKDPYQLFGLIVGSSAGAGVAIQCAASTLEGKLFNTAEKAVANHQSDAEFGFADPSFLRNLRTGFGLWGSKYSSSTLFKMCENGVGKGKLSETLVHIVVPVIDRATNKIRLLSTRKARENPETEDFFLSDIGTAALGFPGFFTPWRMKSPIIRQGQPENHLTASDAGPKIYNPGALALKEAYEIQKQKILSDPLLTEQEKINKIKKIKKPKMLDIGSGIPKQWVEPKASDSSKELRINSSGLVQNFKMIIAQMFQGLGINAQDGVEAFFGDDEHQNNYSKLQVLLTKEKDGTYPFVLDDKRPEVTNALISQTIDFTKTPEFLSGMRKIFGSELKSPLVSLKKENFLIKLKPIRASL